MHKRVVALLLGAAVCAIATAGGDALADVDLANTSWSSPEGSGCNVEITFNGNGTATVTEVHHGQSRTDSAHWTTDGSEVHVTYDKWQGGLDGIYVRGGTVVGQSIDAIKVTETYQDEDSGTQRARACSFLKQ
jgi:hypothetical protein